MGNKSWVNKSWVSPLRARDQPNAEGNGEAVQQRLRILVVAARAAGIWHVLTARLRGRLVRATSK